LEYHHWDLLLQDQQEEEGYLELHLHLQHQWWRQIYR
jgi:hypothetical protein